MTGKTYITDAGELVMKDADGVETPIGRYGVWKPSRGRGYEVCEVGNDLEALMKKYDVAAEDVRPFPMREQ